MVLTSPVADASPGTGPPPAGAVVWCEGLSRRYGAVEALNGLSLSVDPGEVVGLLGPNGAGKTTAMRILTTMLPPTAGRFAIAGHPGADRTDIRRRIGVFPENSGYPDVQSGREVLEYHGRLHGHERPAARERASALLVEVGLGDAADAPVRTYSRGMRQRLGLARALVNDPAALFLDEPTLGLDPAGRAQVLEMIAVAARRRHAGVVVSTHLLDEIERTCDRAVILNHGRLIAQGTIEALRALGGSPRGVRLEVAGDPEAAVRVLAAHRAVGGLERDGAVRGGLDVTIRPGVEMDGASAEILGALLRARVVVRSFGVETPSLESAFLALTAEGR